MICPRCSLADISASGQCALCGFSPSAGVILKESVVEEVREVIEQSTGGRFAIQTLLRLGERSLVYLAREPGYDRHVALKVIPVADGVGLELAQRFERQAQVSQRLQHAHIVPIWAFGTSHTFLWYTMEYVHGQTLADVLRESGPLSLDRCLGIAEQVATALDYAHRHGVVHGDLKPTNIMFDDRWIRVSDFAILDAFGRHATSGAAGPVLRMPEYMAPEQFYARTPGPSADQYALAIIVHQILTGTPPFIGDSFEEVARRQANDRPSALTDIRKDVPAGVADAVTRALSKRPTDRFQTVLEFVTALAAGATAPAQPPGAPALRRPSPTPLRVSAPRVLLVDQEPERRWRRRLIVGGLIAAMIAAALIIQQRASKPGRALEPMVTAPIGPAPRTGEAGEPATLPSERRAPTSQIQAPGAPTTSPSPAREEPSPISRPATSTPRTANPAATPSVPATLFVNATPWGQLYIDGQLIGNTPRGNLRLTPGRHAVRIQREGFEPYERTLTVTPGEVVRLTDIELRPRSQ
ncbi:MAG TPA: protein kinase [Gemmatimonadales bacterium]|nr:protein kinase [Gemmatimonadales bacterium]